MPHTPVKVSTNERSDFLNDLLAFIQDRGFMWGPFPELYGGVSGFYAYGPYGKLLKHKVEALIRRVFQRHGFWEVECPLVLPDIVWKASGHLDTFVDRVVTCTQCTSRFRADKIVEEHYDVSADSFTDKQLLEFISVKQITCPTCKGKFAMSIHKHNLMMKTNVADMEASLRPETATVTYLPFKRYYEFFRKRLPFMVFQIGKAFRNEISPRQHVLRGREFTQAEGQIFIDPELKDDWPFFESAAKKTLFFQRHDQSTPERMTLADLVKKKYVSSKAYAWCLYLAYEYFLSLGIPEEKLRLRQHAPEERAFYARDAWDLECHLTSFGWIEMAGIHDRGDYDLQQHAKVSKTPLQADGIKGKIVPHVLELAFGVDRPTFALLDLFYRKAEKERGKTMFAVPYHLAPVDVSVFPLMKKDEMPELALRIKKELEPHFVVDYDDSGSIGRRYLRAAEAGTPYCVTVDYDSLKNKDVTIRDRDSEKQIRVPIKELAATLLAFFENPSSFSRAPR